MSKTTLELGQDVITLLTAGAVLGENEVYDLIYDTVEDLDDAAEVIGALVFFVHGLAESFGVTDLQPSLARLGTVLAANPDMLAEKTEAD